MVDVKIESIDNFRRQANNANSHTERGMDELEKSITKNGFVAPLTVAADNQAIDGSARLEKLESGLLGDEAIVIEHDGTRPIIMRRVDIPNADTEEARRIALAVNRVAELNLEWDPKVIEGLMPDEIGSLFNGDEMAGLLASKVEFLDRGEYSKGAYGRTAPAGMIIINVGNFAGRCSDQRLNAVVSKLVEKFGDDVESFLEFLLQVL